MLYAQKADEFEKRLQEDVDDHLHASHTKAVECITNAKTLSVSWLLKNRKF
jgi:hypothetical protein